MTGKILSLFSQEKKKKQNESNRYKQSSLLEGFGNKSTFLWFALVLLALSLGLFFSTISAPNRYLRLPLCKKESAGEVYLILWHLGMCPETVIWSELS